MVSIFAVKIANTLKKTKSAEQIAYPLVRKSVTSHRKFSQLVTVGGKFRYARPDYNPITPHPSPRSIHLEVKMFIIFPSWVMVRVVPRCLFNDLCFRIFFPLVRTQFFSVSIGIIILPTPSLTTPLPRPVDYGAWNMRVVIARGPWNCPPFIRWCVCVEENGHSLYFLPRTNPDWLPEPYARSSGSGR